MASINLSTLAAGATSATALSNLILASPQSTMGYQPQTQIVADTSTGSGALTNPLTSLANAITIPGIPASQTTPKAFLFDYEGEQTVTLTSDITDHYIENNTAVNDQIALKPVIITTHGFVGELNDILPNALAIAGILEQKLAIVGAYQPALTASILNQINQAVALYNTASNIAAAAVSAWGSLTGTGTQTKQQIAFSQFYGYYRNKTLFTLQTPWAIFNNMAIMTLRSTQDAETNTVTDFEITFKKMNFVNVVNPGPSVQGQLQQQAAPTVNNGTSTPQPAAGSFASQPLVPGGG